jgi:hypothetical protein
MNQLALSLTPEHAACLLDYMHQYRGVLLTQLSPSTERNQRQRLVQGVQGRLLQECERGGAFATLPLSREELATLRVMVGNLLAATRAAPASARRVATLLDLAELKLTLERLALTTTARPITDALW